MDNHQQTRTIHIGTIKFMYFKWIVLFGFELADYWFRWCNFIGGAHRVLFAISFWSFVNDYTVHM